MTTGTVITIEELIALKRYAEKFSTPPNVNAIRQGCYLSKHRGRGMDFSEVRHYQSGDEIRHMAWRMTARTGKPHVKMYQEERERPVVILNDFAPSMFFGTVSRFKSIVAAELAALIGWMAIKRGDKTGGLMSNGERHREFMPRSREHGLLPFLAGLSELSRTWNQPTLKTPEGLNRLFSRVRRVAKPGSTLVLISDFYTCDADTQRHLTRLRAHNELLFYHVCDPLELSPPKPGVYPISNGDETMWLDLTSSAMNNQYRVFCKDRQTRVQNLAYQLHSDYFMVSVMQDLPTLARMSFQRSHYG